MMNLRQIRSLLDASAYRRLLDRLLGNGRMVSPAFRRRLQDPPLIRPATDALALQRVCELTYAPCELGQRLAARAEAHLESAWPWPRDPRRMARLLPSVALNLRALSAWQSLEDDAEPLDSQLRSSRRAAARSKRQRLAAAVAGAIRRPEVVAIDPVAVEIATWQMASMPADTRIRHTERTVAA